MINGSFVNNGTILGRFDDTVVLSGVLKGDFVNSGRVEYKLDSAFANRWGYSVVMNGLIIDGAFTNASTGVITSNSNHPVEITNTFIRQFNNHGLISHTASVDKNWGPAVGLFGGKIGVLNNTGTMTDSSTPQNGWLSGALALLSWNPPGGTASLVPGSTIGAGGVSSSIDTLNNSGTMSVTNAAFAQSAIKIDASNSIGTINNTGAIWTAGTNYYGIENRGTITTLNNYQGASGSHGSALTYSRFLPTNYNMIAYGDRYGQLSIGDVDASSGTMMFGVFGGDAAYGIAPSQLRSGTYQDVVTGVTQSAYSNTFTGGAAFGSYNGLAWMLRDATYRSGAATAWDLTTLNFGLDMAEPQRALLEQRQSAIRTGLDQDCKAFDKDKLCVWVQARRSGLGDAQESAGVVTVAKRINDDVRLGGFVDMPLSGNEVRGVQMKSRSPVLGLFAAYSAGQSGTGLQARAAVAFQDGKADITRDSLMDAATQLTGSAKVVSQGASLRLGWGAELDKQVLVTPYVGMRSAQSKRGAYSDGAGAADSWSYAAYGERRTTGSLGLDFDVNRGQALSYRLGLGVDRDSIGTLDPFQATSSLLGELSYSNQPKARATRVFGTAGVRYIIEPNRTLTLDLRANEMDFGNKLGYAVQVGYRMAF